MRGDAFPGCQLLGVGRISAPHCIEEAFTKGSGDPAPASIAGALGPVGTIGTGGRRGVPDVTAELPGSEPERQMPVVRARLVTPLGDIRQILFFEVTEEAIDRGARLGHVRLGPRLGTRIDRFAIILAHVGQRLRVIPPPKKGL